MEPMSTVTMAGTTYEIVDKQAREQIKTITDAEDPAKAAIIELIYPVGSVYISANSTNPSVLFGGTWVQISQGRMLMGAAPQGSIQQNTGNTGLFGTLDSNELNYKFEAGQLGGKYRHTLSAAESGMPAHAHAAGTDRAYATAPAGSTIGEKGAASGTAFYTPSIASDSNWYTQQNTGTSTAAAAQNPHNNMPPYMTVNIWQRTA